LAVYKVLNAGMEVVTAGDSVKDFLAITIRFDPPPEVQFNEIELLVILENVKLLEGVKTSAKDFEPIKSISKLIMSIFFMFC
jgi:hypothetical protein